MSLGSLFALLLRLTETPMSTCSDGRNKAAGQHCCCPKCLTRRPGICCECIPTFLCCTFYPDDPVVPGTYFEYEVELVGTEVSGVTYYSSYSVAGSTDGVDGLYIFLERQEGDCCSWSFTYLAPGNITPLTPPLGLTPEQINDLTWHIEIPIYGICDLDAITGSSTDLLWPITRGTYGRNWDLFGLGLPCDWKNPFTGDKIFAVFPNSFLGSGLANNGQFGTWVIKASDKVATPLAPVNGNPNCKCYSYLCPNCPCFSKCLCIAYEVTYFEYNPDYGDPGEDYLVEIGGHSRHETVCFDPDVGSDGGWLVVFPQDPNNACAGSRSVLVEIVKNESTGLCEMVIDGDTRSDDPSFGENCDSLITESWTEWIREGYTGTGDYGSTGTGTDAYVSIRRRVSVISDNCQESCFTPCCSSTPDQLLVTIDGSCLEEPVEVLMDKIKCGSSAYYLAPFQLTYDCAFEEGGSEEDDYGTMDVTLRFSCQGCTYNRFPFGECICDCDITVATPPEEGCMLMNQFILDNAVNQYGDPPSTLVNTSNTNSLCGVHSLLGTVLSTCVPIFAVFRWNISGIGVDCCEKWTITVTEVDPLSGS